MSLRSLGYLITRRFYPRKIYSVQAESSVSAAGRPGRSLHTLRDLSTGHDAYYSALVAAAAGGLGILIFKKHHPDEADCNVTNEDTKEVSRKTEVTDNKLLQEVSNVEKQDVDMEAMFHEWMKQVGRVYPNQEETKRFEVFKKRVKQDPLYEKLSVRNVPKSDLADRTNEEVMAMRGCIPRVNADEHFEELEAFRRIFERAQKMMEEGKLKNHNGSLLFPEKQEREQKMKEEGNVTNKDTKELSRKPEVTDNKLMQEVTNLEKQDVDMEAMFHEWMKQVGRVYPNQEEETKRFEIFKKTVKQDPLYGKLSVPYLPKSPLADKTYEEIKVMRGYTKRVFTVTRTLKN